jgi:hypothetical protein
MCVMPRKCEDAIGGGEYNESYTNFRFGVARGETVCYSNSCQREALLSSVAARIKRVAWRVLASNVVQPQESCPGHRAGSSGTKRSDRLAGIAEPPEQGL